MGANAVMLPWLCVTIKKKNLGQAMLGKFVGRKQDLVFSPIATFKHPVVLSWH